MNLLIIVLAFIIDWVLGDPVFTLHPVRCIGRLAVIIENFWTNLLGKTKSAGMLACLSVVLISSIPIIITYFCLNTIAPQINIIFSIAIVYFSFALKDLIKHGLVVYKNLKQYNIQKARLNLAMIVSRDTSSMNRTQITNSTLESLAENFNDSVIAPLFYALIFGTPLQW